MDRPRRGAGVSVFAARWTGPEVGAVPPRGFLRSSSGGCSPPPPPPAPAREPPPTIPRRPPARAPPGERPPATSPTGCGASQGGADADVRRGMVEDVSLTD